MNNIKVKTRFDYKTLKTANLYILNVKKKTNLVSIILAAVCLVAGIYSLFISKENNNTFLGVAFLVLAVLPVYSILTVSKKIDKSIFGYLAKSPAYNQYLEFTDESVTLVVKGTDKLEKQVYDWAYVQEINVLKDYYLLFLNGNIPLVVSRNEEDTFEGTQDALSDLMREKGLLKPYRVYEKEILKNFNDPVNYIEAEEETLEEVLAKFAEPVVEEVETEELEEKEEVAEAEVVEEVEETMDAETPEEKE